MNAKIVIVAFLAVQVRIHCCLRRRSETELTHLLSLIETLFGSQLTYSDKCPVRLSHNDLSNRSQN
jgi:hypothetical protein